MIATLVGRVALALAVAVYALAAWLSQTRGFDQDEFLHVHLAWLMHTGHVAYRDYFDQYTPLFNLGLAPFLHFFRVETAAADAISFLYFARGLMWLHSGIILILTYWLGTLWRNRTVAVVALPFLLCTEAYLNRVLEVRPDPLSLTFLLLYLIVVLRAIADGRTNRERSLLFALGGVLLACGFLTMQKIVCVFPGVAVGLSWLVLRAPRDRRHAHLMHVVYQSIGFAATLIVTAVVLYRQGALYAFIHETLLFYLGVPGFSSLPNLHAMTYQNPFLVIGGVWALCASLFSVASGPRRPQDVIVVPATLSLIVALFLIPLPHYQYYLFFLPLLSLFAADGCLTVADWLAERRDRLTARRWSATTLAALGAVLALLALLAKGAGSHWSPALFVTYWLIAILACVVLIYRKAPHAALAVFLVTVSIGPLKRIQSQLRSPDPSPQLAEIRYIIEHTDPSATIMDGYQGSGVFRPHAYFYWFLAETVRGALTAVEKQQLLIQLRSGSMAPSVILLDHNLRGLSPDTTSFFERAYEPVGTGVIWRLKTDAALH